MLTSDLSGNVLLKGGCLSVWKYSPQKVVYGIWKGIFKVSIKIGTSCI